MDIKVNEAEWNALNKTEQQKIKDIVSGHFKGANIVPDTATPASGVNTKGLLTGPCKIACGIAEAAAVTVCAGLQNPIAVVACMAAAQAAGDECRRHC